ncbi:hypothetical protein [Aquabacterium sp.]|uniref:hypothetical protein n=1 Tax=Aquabacterium sp. TaxID=1872578 RepID=UPI002D0D29EE|nr:hypothetical protein [Aquabacterium sp.]HSW05046.1 hypothetical protein [Aquabacterium sp.]
MLKFRSAVMAGVGRCVRVAGLVGLLALTGCGSFYVDTATKEVPAAQFKKPATARPVQLLFEFQTKGALNARATDHLKAQVSEQVKASGLFSDVQDKAVAGGALLSIVLNNVPLTDNAFGKGFVTGLTFGLAGSQVSDGYVCTAKYLAEGQAEPIVKTARHAIHTTVGAAAAPANAVQAENIEAAVRTMTRDIVSTSLNELSQELAK